MPFLFVFVVLTCYGWRCPIKFLNSDIMYVVRVFVCQFNNIWYLAPYISRTFELTVNCCGITTTAGID